MKYLKLFEQFNEWDPFREEKFVSETQRRLDKMVGDLDINQMEGDYTDGKTSKYLEEKYDTIKEELKKVFTDFSFEEGSDEEFYKKTLLKKDDYIIKLGLYKDSPDMEFWAGVPGKSDYWEHPGDTIDWEYVDGQWEDIQDEYEENEPTSEDLFDFLHYLIGNEGKLRLIQWEEIKEEFVEETEKLNLQQKFELFKEWIKIAHEGAMNQIEW